MYRPRLGGAGSMSISTPPAAQVRGRWGSGNSCLASGDDFLGTLVLPVLAQREVPGRPVVGQDQGPGVRDAVDDDAKHVLELALVQDSARDGGRGGVAGGG